MHRLAIEHLAEGRKIVFVSAKMQSACQSTAHFFFNRVIAVTSSSASLERQEEEEEEMRVTDFSSLPLCIAIDQQERERGRNETSVSKQEGTL